MSSVASLLFACLLLVPGLALIAMAIVSHVVRSRTRQQRATAVGMVVELIRQPRGGLAPVVEFTAPAGAAVRFNSAFSVMPTTHRVGETIPVLFDPSRPEAAEADTWMSRWFLTVLLAAFGAALLLVGAIGAVFFLIVAHQ